MIRKPGESPPERETLYRVRFNPEEQDRKDCVWKVLCEQFFQRYVSPDAHVLDLAAGFGEFLNHIRASEKTAIDLNPETASHLAPKIRFLNRSAESLEEVESGSVDVVFASNFLEHLPDREALSRVLREAFRVLCPGGRLMILQPNIRLVGGAYWDFIDHRIPLTERSCSELLESLGFTIEKIIPRFLPYTTKSPVPQSPFLVRLYLSFPPAWRLLGKQSFIVAAKPRVCSVESDSEFSTARTQADRNV